MNAVEILLVASIYAPALVVIVGILALAVPTKRAERRTESTAAIAAH